ncbi:MAG: GNAT family N-acetyltransferase [Gemmataceae bacterium]|nr:GNAT family N-acetyltransferase [Gemmataceae bacterium]
MLTAPAPSLSLPAASGVPAQRSERVGPVYRVDLADAAGLVRQRPSWERLASAALEPNCFYEPWMCLPALEHLGAPASRRIAVVIRDDGAERSEWCGFFPCERRRSWHGVPVRVLTLWRHKHCVLGTPLLHRDHAAPALQAFLAWAGTAPEGAAVVEFPIVAADGPFFQCLVDTINDLRLLTFTVEQYNRALLRPGRDAETYLRAALAPKHRRDLERLRRRLSELGRLETRRLEPSDDPQPWIVQFLELEASGWKGAQGTALAHSSGDRKFFSAVVSEAHARGQLLMLGLFLDGRPIAMKCNFRSGHGAFALKIAFDERFARFSPGVLLELDNIALVHAGPDLAWMDSCAVAKHPMIDRLWTERRLIQHLLLSTGGWYGNLIVGALPLLRAVKRTVVGRRRRTAT